MEPTNMSSNEEETTVRIQCKTLGNDQFDMDPLQIQELFKILAKCKYNTVGCMVNDYVKDIKTHEDFCLYGTVRCTGYSDEGFCKDFLALNLVEHVTQHHDSSCIPTEENFVSLPIDLEKKTTSSKMITILKDIILVCNVKIDDHKLHTSLVFLRNTNPFMNCEITLMAEDVKWKNHKIDISNSVSGFNEYSKQSVVFDLQKLIELRNAFTSITLRIEFNIPAPENIAHCEKFLQNVICANCGDFLSSDYYECQGKHMYCETCYVLKEYLLIKDNKPIGRSVKHFDSKLCNICNLQIINCKLSLLFPCENVSLGCKQHIPRFTSKHELLCDFKIFNCAFDKCKFSGAYLDFTSHLQENHKDSIITTNVYNVTDMNPKLCYMFAFGSVFLCDIINNQACTIEWISTLVLNHNFIFEVTFVGEEKRIILRTNSDPREIYSKPDYYKSIYNTIKKTASFNIYEKELSIVGEIILKIYKM